MKPIINAVGRHWSPVITIIIVLLQWGDIRGRVSRLETQTDIILARIIPTQEIAHNGPFTPDPRRTPGRRAESYHLTRPGDVVGSAPSCSTDQESKPQIWARTSFERPYAHSMGNSKQSPPESQGQNGLTVVTRGGVATYLAIVPVGAGIRWPRPAEIAGRGFFVSP